MFSIQHLFGLFSGVKLKISQHSSLTTDTCSTARKLNVQSFIQFFEFPWQFLKLSFCNVSTRCGEKFSQEVKSTYLFRSLIALLNYMHEHTKTLGSNVGPKTLPLKWLLLHFPLLCGALPSPLRLLDNSEFQNDVRKGLCYQVCSRLLFVASALAGNRNDTGNIGYQ